MRIPHVHVHKPHIKSVKVRSHVRHIHIPQGRTHVSRPHHTSVPHIHGTLGSLGHVEPVEDHAADDEIPMHLDEEEEEDTMPTLGSLGRKGRR